VKQVDPLYEYPGQQVLHYALLAAVASDGTTNNEHVFVVAALTHPPFTKKYPF
jgi:hypothetical protein